MSEYDKLLEQAREKAEAFRSTAMEYVPKMYRALRDENPNLTPEHARVRIEKDCVGIWSKRTILDALPDEAKDQKKQKAGRLSQKEANSAAVSAAQEKKKEEIIIDTQGKPIEKDTPSPITTTTLSSIDVPSPPSDNNNGNQLQDNSDNNLFDFEFSLPSQYVWDHIFPFVIGKENEKNSLWFEGVIDIRTRKVISAAIGRLE